MVSEVKVQTRRHMVFLVLAAAIWGMAFVAQRKSSDAIGPFTFNGIRSLLGGVVLLPVIALLDRAGLSGKKKSSRMAESKKKLVAGGIFCGMALFAASSFQQIGIYQGTAAGKAGFLTACYILLVPVFGLFLGQKSSYRIWAGVGLAVLGLYFLCMNDSMSIQKSDVFVFLSAVCFAVHILVIDHYAPFVDGVRLSCIQFFVCGILSAVPMAVFETGHSAAEIIAWAGTLSGLDAWLPILYAGICSSGVGYTLQVVGQRGVNPTAASMLLSLESVFSVLAGALFLGERLTGREIFGCVLIFAAIVFVQLVPSQASEK